ncbi:PucR family transcriptional regulator [Rhodococcus sp. ACPA4]|uniref:Helix-turn-helix domain-containing protein n=1 Tax=Rhodococcus globerulus TaxID=33008 RepID=A0ABU4BY29_RHOGO|nr:MULTISPECIES: helix-turn-helix domain-containing protein [Rhodococcus]KJF21914.1 Sugar diacid utilization regulator [Rhodococcus sp. AD45]MCE4263138.1 PucR family transcriptional regulator [Rhodococcus globerulus]MDV6269150.1 helix-turn-helix domain-containing protein [Rhodococcus globerulus]MDV8067637.1 helix-turn-helix domain-containing protein [Rhodococcus sp. IEGM 1366]NRI67414.1 PucR family transcriptional regulator [Rhodococcus sp. MS16]
MPDPDSDVPASGVPPVGVRRIRSSTSGLQASLSRRRQVRDPLPEALLRRVKQFSGRLATEAVTVMEEQLPFFDTLDASHRADVQLLVQTSVVNFLEWLRQLDSEISFGYESFPVIPQELARRLTLRQTVDMVRVAMEFFEKWLPALARNDQQLIALTEAVLRYGRELGFAAASVYASAAESRGALDSRLEALVVDAVVRGDTGSDMLSRAATLNWDATAPATVIVGSPPPDERVSVAGTVHATAAAHGRAVLAVVQGSRLVMVVSGDVTSKSAQSEFMQDLLRSFAGGPVVIGPTTPSLSAAHFSASEAFAGIKAVVGWRGAPRPVFATELLPERALLGDQAAVDALQDHLVTPLAESGSVLTDTLDTYLDCGGAVETCARQLFVHPNTVRYRLKRITEVTGRDPTNPRDAYVLRIAATVGRLSEIDNKSDTTFTPVTPFTV